MARPENPGRQRGRSGRFRDRDAKNARRRGGVEPGLRGERGVPHLRAGGYPLRQVLYFVGEKSTLEVTSVAIKDLPAADFAIPKGFKKVGYAELLLGEGE